MSASVKPLPIAFPVLSVNATLTSKGQITIPVQVRRALGAAAGDKLTFETTAEGAVLLLRKNDENTTENQDGAAGWLPEGYEGRDGIVRYFREMRGHDEFDHID